MADLQTATVSETAASNNAASPDGAPEGMAYAGVNDTIRENMGSAKREWNRSHPTLSSGGTSSAITLTYTTAPPAYVQGFQFAFKVTTTNADNATLNVNALGAKKLYIMTLSGPIQVRAGDLAAGNHIVVTYDTALDASAGGFMVWKLDGGLVGRATGVFMGSAQSIANNTVTTLNAWSATQFDTLGAWSAGSPSRLTVPTGVTLVQVVLRSSWAYSGSTGTMSVLIVKNGATARGSDTRASFNSTGATIVCVDSVTAGDYFEAQAFQSTGGAINFVGSGDGSFSMTVLR